MTDAIDRADKVAVGDGVRWLFQLPEILRQTSDRRRWIENNLSAVQPKGARAFRKVPVIADVDTNAGVGRVESREAEIAWLEIEFLPEARVHVRNVMLAILAEIGPVSINHGGGV